MTRGLSTSPNSGNGRGSGDWIHPFEQQFKHALKENVNKNSGTLESQAHGSSKMVSKYKYLPELCEVAAT